ncbi:hypothetical protein BGZ93_009889 [Podila epicladia]|nr:hypothetical protein BGZ92_007662 [Podila epicladia]KAG0098916.1 hypothetical protein BGZ93_009889 [Podila epicladia]
MVRISLSFLSVAAFALTSAAPYAGQVLFGSHDRISVQGQCLPNTDIKEYQPFLLFSSGLNSIVSKRAGSSSIVGGIYGDKSLQQLQFCLVTTDGECTTTMTTDCIHESLDYSFRLYGPVKGYLRVVGPFLRIVENFKEASGFQLEVAGDEVVRVVHRNKEGVLYDLSALKPGRPIVLEIPDQIQVQHLFGLVNPNDEFQENVQSFESNKCIPEVDIKEYQSFNKKVDNLSICLPDTLIKEYNPFQLFSYNLDNYVSKKVGNNLLVGGLTGDKSFQQLQFCIVSSDRACTTTATPTTCIYQNAQYRVRVQGPVKGYLHVSGGRVDIVEHYDQSSVVNLFKDSDWGLRIGYVNGLGEQYVFATTAKGQPIVLELPKKDRIQQFFELAKPRKEGGL